MGSRNMYNTRLRKHKHTSGDIVAVDMLTAIGIGGASGLSSGALLMFILRSLEKRIGRAEKNLITQGEKISNLKKEMYVKLDEQEDCWEEEIGKVHGEVTDVNGKLDRVITVMQMQATSSGHPELVSILKGGN